LREVTLVLPSPFFFSYSVFKSVFFLQIPKPLFCKSVFDFMSEGDVTRVSPFLSFLPPASPSPTPPGTRAFFFHTTCLCYFSRGTRRGPDLSYTVRVPFGFLLAPRKPASSARKSAFCRNVISCSPKTPPHFLLSAVCPVTKFLFCSQVELCLYSTRPR